LRRAAYVVPPSAFQFMAEQYLSQLIEKWFSITIKG
jgi:hypothetical protein